MKKVLFFRPSLGDGGADRVTWTLLRHLDRAQFAPSIALMRAEGPFLADLPEDVGIHELGSRRLALAVAPLTSLLRRERPDVVFSTSSAGNIICVAAHKAARSKAYLVLSERNALFRGRARDLKQRVEVVLKRFTYGLADIVTAVSQGVADQLVEDVGVSRDRVRVVYNPMVDEDLSRHAAEQVDHPWFADRSVPVIAACARLVEQKGYPTLLAAFAKLRAKRPARLYVLGEGPMRGELEAEAARLGVAGDVCFAGFDKNPFKYFARARILMHASRAEGLPGALIQSMACGAPVVSTDCDFGPREVIRDGVDGYLVAVGDADALAARAEALLGDDVLRAKMSAEGVVSSKRFTLTSSIARYQAALEGHA
jgi:glycosyltransferase involved in cell wall biosynthesis